MLCAPFDLSQSLASTFHTLVILLGLLIYISELQCIGPEILEMSQKSNYVLQVLLLLVGGVVKRAKFDLRKGRFQGGDRSREFHDTTQFTFQIPVINNASESVKRERLHDRRCESKVVGVESVALPH